MVQSNMQSEKVGVPIFLCDFFIEPSRHMLHFSKPIERTATYGVAVVKTRVL
jgi:hypothetical protein